MKQNYRINICLKLIRNGTVIKSRHSLPSNSFNLYSCPSELNGMRIGTTTPKISIQSNPKSDY